MTSVERSRLALDSFPWSGSNALSCAAMDDLTSFSGIGESFVPALVPDLDPAPSNTRANIFAWLCHALGLVFVGPFVLHVEIWHIVTSVCIQSAP